MQDNLPRITPEQARQLAARQRAIVTTLEHGRATLHAELAPVLRQVAQSVANVRSAFLQPPEEK